MSDEKQRVHIGLASGFRDRVRGASREDAAKAVQDLADKLKVSAPDIDRAIDMGVLSADAPSEDVSDLNNAQEVDWVEADEKRGAL